MARKLFDEFDEVSTKAWKQKIQYDLRGLDYNETLIWESPEGIKVKPFYSLDDLEDLEKTNIPSNGPWKIGQEVFADDAFKANEKAIAVLENGVESLIFNIPSENVKIENLLKGIDLNSVPVHFNLQFLSPDYSNRIFEFSKTSKSEIHLNLDIIGHLVRTGNWFDSLKEDHEILETIASTFVLGPKSSILSVDTALYQNAGASIVQQLAYAIAHANEYLNHGLIKKEQGVLFKVAIGSNYFFEIAKIRAFRLLWKTLAKEYGNSTNCHIVAHPSKRNKTLYDYNLNMLRTTSECMAAVLGGADTIVNLRYDSMYHKDNEFAERIARNQLLILKNESYLGQVENTADGAYYIETLTYQLAEKALLLFKDIESGGGFLKQLKNHTIQKKIKESAQKEQVRFDTKEEVLIGTNKYQNTNDRMKHQMEISPFIKTQKRKTLIEPILERRLSKALEQLRLKNE